MKPNDTPTYLTMSDMFMQLYPNTALLKDELLSTYHDQRMIQLHKNHAPPEVIKFYEHASTETIIVQALIDATDYMRHLMGKP